MFRMVSITSLTLGASSFCLVASVMLEPEFVPLQGCASDRSRAAPPTARDSVPSGNT